ncbi:HD domain-containing protein [Lachnotalea glycerini]|uniref:HD domain-containing protein n=1 Tax=Lachnotalea glycerini TaxID=1763509 RepID=A0A371JJV9_9FIRM|nr:HD domain-containing protein [Lachnotalea glycerini]RDY32990.1 HD domain-containing protein [Lachnotalea glycerini]
MQITMFAAIDIGSYEVGMKIFELSSKAGMKQVDFIRHRIELGKDAYVLEKIGCDLTDKLCNVLMDFVEIMKSYQVDAYRACATSAVREAKNTIMLLDQIRLRTGLKVEVLSNSEQRFLRYKSIAYRVKNFDKIIQTSTAILDVGGGSTQFSLYDKDTLIATQNIRMGSLRIREKLAGLSKYTTNIQALVEELVNSDISNLYSQYVRDYTIKNIIAVGDYLNYMQSDSGDYITREKFLSSFENVFRLTTDEIAAKLFIPEEEASLLIPSLIIYKRIIEETGAEFIWTPGVKLSDGIAYDYAENNKIIKVKHNFEHDIIASAQNIGKRYMNNKEHTKMLEELSLKIFDSTVKIHGMGERERLLLQIAVILHDCGKYISLSAAAECSYNIIMATEIIGLSHLERQIIANAVKFNTTEFVYYDALAGKIDKASYILLEKLTAILRVSNALDRSHRQKFKNVKVVLKDKELIITVDTVDNIVLEKGLFGEKAEFFEEVFSIKPVIKQNKKC